MKTATRGLACAGALLALFILFAPVGCNEEESCPEGVALSGSDFPCACGDTTWDAIPPTEEGVICTCDPEEGFVCASEEESCPEGVALSGSDLPCACGETIWEDIPPTEEGVICTCDPVEGFVCALPDCPEDVSLTGEELPCQCADERVDALPGDGSDCFCRPDEGLLCAMDSSSGSGEGE